LLAVKNGKRGFVPALYVDTKSIIPSPAESPTKIRKLSAKVEQAPKRLSERSFISTCNSMPEEDVARNIPKLFSVSALSPGETKRFSWEYTPEENIDGSALYESAWQPVQLENEHSKNVRDGNFTEQPTLWHSREKNVIPWRLFGEAEGNNMPRYQSVDDGQPSSRPILRRPGQLSESQRNRNNRPCEEPSTLRSSALLFKRPSDKCNQSSPCGSSQEYPLITKYLKAIESGHPLSSGASQHVILRRQSVDVTESDFEQEHGTFKVFSGSIKTKSKLNGGLMDEISQIAEAENPSDIVPPAENSKSWSKVPQMNTNHSQDAKGVVETMSMLHRPHPLKKKDIKKYFRNQ
jgi:hypothetical protein